MINFFNKSPKEGDKMLYINWRNFVNTYLTSILDLIAKMLAIL